MCIHTHAHTHILLSLYNVTSMCVYKVDLVNQLVLNKDISNRHAKADREKPMRPHLYIKILGNQEMQRVGELANVRFKTKRKGTDKFLLYVLPSIHTRSPCSTIHMKESLCLLRKLDNDSHIVCAKVGCAHISLSKCHKLL